MIRKPSVISLAAAIVLTFLGALSAPTAVLAEVPVVDTWVGGGGYGEPVVSTGLWDFDNLSADQRAASANCENTVFSPFGDQPANMGWQPSPDSNLPPRLEQAAPWLESPSGHVGGTSLVFYESTLGGFHPFQRSLMECPQFPAQFGENPAATWELSFWTNANADLDPSQISLVVGSRFLRDGVWTEWEDVHLPIVGGSRQHRVLLNIAADAEAGQARVGVENEAPAPVPDRGPAVDEVKAEVKTPVTTSTWKYVPDISQGDAAICQASAFANCLSYWANNGYPELAPAQGTQQEKNEKIQEDLKKKVHDENKGDGGVTGYMKDKGVLKGQQQPGNRKPLQHTRMSNALALWDSLKANFEKCHDVLLRVTWCDEEGNPIDEDAGHYMTVAGITVDENGNKKIHVANPWGESHHAPTEATRDDAYDVLEATVGDDGKVRLDNDHIEDNADGIDGADHLCLTHINIIRPYGGNAPPRGIVHSISAGDRSLVTHGYATGNDSQFPLNEWALILEVPYQDVVAPAGWTWEPLPADYQSAMGCGDRLEPAGILWSTTTDAIPPGGYLSGFEFKTDSQYPVEELGVIWWTDTEDGEGEYGAVDGPVPVPASAADLEMDRSKVVRLSSYPNPSNGSMRIRFTQDAPGPIRLEVFDVSGRLVRRIVERTYPAGSHELSWDRRSADGHPAPAGVYELRATTGGGTQNRRLVLLD